MCNQQYIPSVCTVSVQVWDYSGCGLDIHIVKESEKILTIALTIRLLCGGGPGSLQYRDCNLIEKTTQHPQ